MEDKVYGIHQGCIHEGGGTGRNLYRNKDKAIEKALKIFDKHLACDKERLEDLDEKDKYYELMLQHRKDFAWRKCDRIENRWHNTCDEVEVIEYKLH